MRSSSTTSEKSTAQKRRAPPMGAVAARREHEEEEVTLVPNNSLMTTSPEEGRALAIRMAMRVVEATQRDENVRKKLRLVYEKDAEMLIQITHVTAIEFATIAAANNYWRTPRQ